MSTEARSGLEPDWQAIHADLQAHVESVYPTDTTPADNMQLAGIFQALQARQVPEQRDPQWAGPSLPHPSEATSEAEYDELHEKWTAWGHGLDVNDLAEGHYDSEALEA